MIKYFMQQSIYTITENGFAMDGSGKVSVPECRIRATSFLEAADKLTQFLSTRILTNDIELITPIEKIQWQS